MGTDVRGYVEVDTVQESDEDTWFNIINIDVIAERNYEVFAELFGVRASSENNAVAESRGIPENTSEKQMFVNSDSIVHQSWIVWSEISDYLSKNNINLNQNFGWQFIFSNMESLSNKYGSNNVRLVVAFDNYG